jgi:hypothetical protein
MAAPPPHVKSPARPSQSLPQKKAWHISDETTCLCAREQENLNYRVFVPMLGQGKPPLKDVPAFKNGPPFKFVKRNLQSKHMWFVGNCASSSF